jgi:signal recognition particle subunit SRP54
MIDSMTKKEQLFPNLLNGSRRRRIAYGSGTTIQDVNRLVKQFEQTRKMMKKLGRGMFGGKGKMKFPFMGM